MKRTITCIKRKKVPKPTKTPNITILNLGLVCQVHQSLSLHSLSFPESSLFVILSQIVNFYYIMFIFEHCYPIIKYLHT
jgi:hypothetical protein